MNKIKNIGIVGLGNIGFRHLEGLYKIKKFRFNLYLFDNKNTQLEKCKIKIRRELKSNYIMNILFFSNLKNCNKINLDLLIISCSSLERYEVTKKFIKHFKLKFIIFEKIMFTKLYQYKNIKKLLEKNHIKSWVNCNYQAQTYFKNLNKIKNKKKISMRVHGGSWNLSSSAIHFLDLFTFLTRSKLYYMSIIPDKKSIRSSKRSKYFDFDALILASDKNLNHIIIENNSENYNYLNIDISFFKHHISIDQYSKQIREISFVNNKRKNKLINYNTLFQSQLTGKISEEIILKKKSILPSYETSAYNHELLITNLKKEFKNTKLIFKNEIFIT